MEGAPTKSPKPDMNGHGAGSATDKVDWSAPIAAAATAIRDSMNHMRSQRLENSGEDDDRAATA